MPEYVYRCNHCGNETVVVEPMVSNSVVFCSLCGFLMQRRPMRIRVNWGGLKPSQGEVAPAIKEMINGAERRREEGHHAN